MLDFKDTVSATIQWQKEHYPNRTTNYDKCERDLNYVLYAYKNDIESNSSRSINYIASRYWFAGQRQIKDHHVEIEVHNFAVDYILKNIELKKEEADKLKDLKDILISIIKNGPEYMNYTHMHKYRYIMEYDTTEQIDPHLIKQCLHEAWSGNPSKQNMMPFNVYVLGPDQSKLKELIYLKSVQKEYLTNNIRYPNVNDNDPVAIEKEMLKQRSLPQYVNFKTAPYLLLFSQRVSTPNPWNQWLAENMHMNFEQTKSDHDGMRRALGLSLIEIGMFASAFTNLCLMHNIDVSHTRCLPVHKEFWSEPEFDFLVNPPQLIMTAGKGIKVRREFYPYLHHSIDYKPDFDEIVKYI